ncbi:unnamed protein product [Hymenolepis diminuta]|uniref:Uncharacterized protein n=1 Tax=Hymenolepis diminuta TaxID=6216 RepID=A0A564Z528_HYMDI|nr:unnamed protein product [Hymenolepis diminuta]
MMGRSCVKSTFLSALGVGFAVGSIDFIRRGNAGIATKVSLLTGIGAGAFVNLLCRTRNISKDMSHRQSFWSYKRELDERLKKKYEQ